MDAKLIVVDGRATKGEIRLKLPAIVGRRKDCGLVISHKSVSREHCEITDRQGYLFLKDNGSANGTFVNGERVSEVRLKPGDKLKVGPLTFVVVYTPPVPLKTKPAIPPPRKAPSPGLTDLLNINDHAAYGPPQRGRNNSAMREDSNSGFGFLSDDGGGGPDSIHDDEDADNALDDDLYPRRTSESAILDDDLPPPSEDALEDDANVGEADMQLTRTAMPDDVYFPPPKVLRETDTDPLADFSHLVDLNEDSFGFSREELPAPNLGRPLMPLEEPPSLSDGEFGILSDFDDQQELTLPLNYQVPSALPPELREPPVAEPAPPVPAAVVPPVSAAPAVTADEPVAPVAAAALAELEAAVQAAATTEAAITEPAATEPAVIEPAATEPAVEPVAEVAAAALVADASVAAEPVVEEPVAEQPPVEELVAEEPAAEVAVVEEPVAEAPPAAETVAVAAEVAEEEDAEAEVVDSEVIESAVVPAEVPAPAAAQPSAPAVEEPPSIEPPSFEAPSLATRNATPALDLPDLSAVEQLSADLTVTERSGYVSNTDAVEAAAPDVPHSTTHVPAPADSRFNIPAAEMAELAGLLTYNDSEGHGAETVSAEGDDQAGTHALVAPPSGDPTASGIAETEPLDGWPAVQVSPATVEPLSEASSLNFSSAVQPISEESLMEVLTSEPYAANDDADSNGADAEDHEDEPPQNSADPGLTDPKQFERRGGGSSPSASASSVS